MVHLLPRGPSSLLLGCSAAVSSATPSVASSSLERGAISANKHIRSVLEILLAVW